MLHYVYIVKCADGTFYTGYATDVSQRINVHNSGKGAKYTRGRLPVSLVFCAELETKPAALSMEYEIKKMSRAKKLALIETF